MACFDVAGAWLRAFGVGFQVLFATSLKKNGFDICRYGTVCFFYVLAPEMLLLMMIQLLYNGLVAIPSFLQPRKSIVLDLDQLEG